MKLKWALNELTAKSDEAFKIEGQHDLKNDLVNRSDDILAASPVEVEGWIIVESEDEIHVDGNLSVDLTMPSTRSLEPVDVKLNVKFQETYVTSDYTVDEEKYDSNDIIIQLEENYLDLTKPFSDSIILALPSQVLTKEERENNLMPEGNDWKVISEDAAATEGSEPNEEDSPFAVLKDLFEDENKDN